ncbi:MAG: GNAT family N-acetyltransferase [Anaerolineales bacterium]|nr:GNAT family N-acetyltransferase [Anaerolineales bacterium]
MPETYSPTQLGENTSVRVHVSVAPVLTECYQLALKSKHAPQIKDQLLALVVAVAKMCQDLHPGMGHREAFRLKVMLGEIDSDPPKPYWWANGLHLTAKTANQTGHTQVKTVIDALVPQLRAYFGKPGEVSFKEVGEDSVWQVSLLSDTLAPIQENFVAPNAISLAEGLLSEKAWFRAVYAGTELVGFIMLYGDAEEAVYFLWRFMIAGPYQGRGYAKEAIDLLVEYVRTRPNATELLVSYGQGEGSPEGFYRKYGFEPNGEIDDNEIIASLKL